MAGSLSVLQSVGLMDHIWSYPIGKFLWTSASTTNSSKVWFGVQTYTDTHTHIHNNNWMSHSRSAPSQVGLTKSMCCSDGWICCRITKRNYQSLQEHYHAHNSERGGLLAHTWGVSRKLNDACLNADAWVHGGLCDVSEGHFCIVFLPSLRPWESRHSSHAGIALFCINSVAENIQIYYVDTRVFPSGLGDLSILSQTSFIDTHCIHRGVQRDDRRKWKTPLWADGPLQNMSSFRKHCFE